MKKDLWILIVTAVIVANMYYDNALVKYAKQWKKYYKMGGVAIFGMLLFLFCRRNPRESQSLLANANDLLKFMPIDRNTSSLLQPILKYNRFQKPNLREKYNYPSVYGDQQSKPNIQPNYPHIGGSRSKRSVSETKKKFVASNQNWQCGDCQTQLTAWFEVDHKLSLEYGGTNDTQNLVALCRNCHGKKTALENM